MAAEELIHASRQLSDQVDQIDFSSVTPWVYNPLVYARQPHDAYVEAYGGGAKRVVFLGMNPGPWGMAQTGVPFGEIRAVREWMGIDLPVEKPEREHPKRPIEGFGCAKSEVSGRRLWGLMERRYPDCRAFFAEHYVANYCPLVFMQETGKNLTPDKLPAALRDELESYCMDHLVQVLRILSAEYAVGVGAYAEQKLLEASRILGPDALQVGRILHPSPASPAANRGWEQQALEQLVNQGIW